MSWFPVDDALHAHPKARKAGFEALGLWTVSGSYCMAYLTDGFVPEWFVKEKPRGMALAKRLVVAGLWHPGVNDEGETGFWFHDWKKECTKERIQADREKARIRKAKSRESQQESQQESHRDEPSDERCESPVLSGTNPTQPNPKENFGYVPESASLSTARDAIAATPGADLVREIIPDNIPASERAMLRIKASALLREGALREDLGDALRLYLAKPHLGAGALPTLVSEVIRSRVAPTVNGHDTKVNDFLAYANQPRQEIEQ